MQVLGFWSSAVENTVLLGYDAAPWLFGSWCQRTRVNRPKKCWPL